MKRLTTLLTTALLASTALVATAVGAAVDS